MLIAVIYQNIPKYKIFPFFKRLKGILEIFEVLYILVYILAINQGTAVQRPWGPSNPHTLPKIFKNLKKI